MKLTTAILTSLMGMTTAFYVAAESNNTNLSVDVQVEGDSGKIIVIKDVDGETITIEEPFTATPDTNVQALIDELLTEHGINDKIGQVHKEIIKGGSGKDNKMIWIQKNEDVNVNLENGQATVIIKSNNNGETQTIEETIAVDENTDIDALVDDLMKQHGIKAAHPDSHRKVIKIDKHFAHIDNNKPRMGFMANVKDNGWQVMSVVPDSGAAEAGMQKGDVVISIDGQSTQKDGLGLTEFIAMDHKSGQASKVVVLRDNKEINLNVTAKVIDSPDIIMELDNGHKWVSSSGKDFQFNTGDLDHMFEGLHVDVEHLNQMVKGLGEHDIHVVTTSDADAYFFSDSKLNQWLGNKHHFSTITESLGQYFGTTAGVLVLEVDKDNKLGLKDGDVIQAINGQAVNSPKEVIKIMSGFNADESFEIEIIRKKETLYLES